MSSKEMKSASDSQLRESLKRLATEYYESGKSGISFGGTGIERAVNSLMSQKRSRASMLMYGKEASNRKQEIDRQHYTIPNQRPKDKHCGKI